MTDDFKNLQVSLVALLEAVDQRKDVDVTEALHEEELDGDLEALDLVEYAQVARIKYDLDNNKSNKKRRYFFFPGPFCFSKFFKLDSSKI